MQTPIQKAIDELKNKYSHSIHPTSTIVSEILNHLASTLPYEQTYLRGVAEKAWDACQNKNDANVRYVNSEEYTLEQSRAKMDYTLTPEKQTYLNQNHPL